MYFYYKYFGYRWLQRSKEDIVGISVVIFVNLTQLDSPGNGEPSSDWPMNMSTGTSHFNMCIYKCKLGKQWKTNQYAALLYGL